MFNIFKLFRETEQQKRIKYYVKSAQAKYTHTTQAKTVYSGKGKNRVGHDLILVNACATFTLPDGNIAKLFTQVHSEDVTTKNAEERSQIRKHWKNKEVTKSSRKSLIAQFKDNIKSRGMSNTELENLFNDVANELTGDK